MAVDRVEGAYDRFLDDPVHRELLRAKAWLQHDPSLVVTYDGAAMSGAKSARQALNDTATAWEQVTDRIGRDKQLADYRAAIGYEDVDLDVDSYTYRMRRMQDITLWGDA